jgi:hypothetical protein
VTTLAVACSGDTASNPGGGPADETLDQINAAARSYCNCVPSGPDRDACLAEADAEAFTINDCQRDLLDSPEGQELVRCVGDIADELDECMAVAGCDTTAVENCGVHLLSGMEACLAASSIGD